jgi:hypothetical protein
MSYALRDYALSLNICYEHTIYTSYGMVGHGEKTPIILSYLYIPMLLTKFSHWTFRTLKLCHRLLGVLSKFLILIIIFSFCGYGFADHHLSGRLTPLTIILLPYVTLTNRGAPTRRRSVALVNLSTGTGFRMRYVNPWREGGSRSQYIYCTYVWYDISHMLLNSYFLHHY